MQMGGRAELCWETQREPGVQGEVSGWLNLVWKATLTYTCFPQSNGSHNDDDIKHQAFVWWHQTQQCAARRKCGPDTSPKICSVQLRVRIKGRKGHRGARFLSFGVLRRQRCIFMNFLAYFLAYLVLFSCNILLLLSYRYIQNYYHYYFDFLLMPKSKARFTNYSRLVSSQLATTCVVGTSNTLVSVLQLLSKI